MENRYEMRAAVRHVSLKLGDRRVYSYPKIGHHFWVLVEINDAGQETIVEAIHGLSVNYYIVDKTGAQQACMASVFQTWNSRLKTYCSTYPIPRDTMLSEWSVPYDKDYWMKPNETFTVHPYWTSSKEVFSMWDKAKQFKDTLNNAELSYSFFGVGKTLGLKCRNSNSIYAAIALHLGFKPHRFEGYKAPGLDTPLLLKTISKNSFESQSAVNQSTGVLEQRRNDESDDYLMDSFTC